MYWFLQSTILVVLGVLLYYIWIKLKLKRHPPGPFKWPIIGNVLNLHMANRNYPHLALQKLADIYGDIVSLNLGSHSTVLLSSFEIIRDMMKKEELTDRYEFPFSRDRAFGKLLGIIHGNGESWSKVRRFTMSTLRDFGYGNKNVMEKVLKEEMSFLLNTIKKEMEENHGILKIDHFFSFGVINILWSSVCGNRFTSNINNPKEILDLNTRYLKFASTDRICLLFPYLNRIFPQLTGFNELHAVHIQLQNCMKGIIQQTRETEATGSFVSTFLQEIDKKEDPDFTEEQLIVVLMDLFLGGSETTSNMLSFSLLYMVLHPETQEKVHQEINATAEGHDFLSLDDVKRMPYTRATMLEMFRLAQIIPIPFGRVATRDILVKGYSIPKNTLVVYNLNSVVMDKTFWKDPEVFRPERFLNDQMEIINAERVPVFGFGRRICPGEGLARNTFFMYFITMMMKFRFETLTSDIPCTDPRPNSNMLTPKPFSVFVQLRN